MLKWLNEMVELSLRLWLNKEIKYLPRIKFSKSLDLCIQVVSNCDCRIHRDLKIRVCGEKNCGKINKHIRSHGVNICIFGVGSLRPVSVLRVYIYMQEKDGNLNSLVHLNTQLETHSLIYISCGNNTFRKMYWRWISSGMYL